MRGIKSEIYKESVPFKSEAEYYTGFAPAEDQAVPNAFIWGNQGKPIFLGFHGQKVIDYQHQVWKVIPRNLFQNLALELMTNVDIHVVSIQSNAGFELASEALYLGKRILVKPVAGQMEQISNAQAITSLDLGKAMTKLNVVSEDRGRDDLTKT